MSVLLQISDLHFGADRPEVVRALVAMAQAEVPEVVVLSGDLTQRGRPGEFRAARAFCDGLGAATLLVLPGNHDLPLFNLPARILFPYANFRRFFGRNLGFEFEDGSMLVLGVNTTRRWRHVHGEISRRQVEQVSTRLREARPDQVRLVVTHQPLDVVEARDRRNLLRGHARALRAWAEAGVDLVLGGHIHRPHLRRMEAGITGSGRRMWSIQAGTAVSRRVRHGLMNSVNLIRVESGIPPRCEVERWDYREETGCFEKVLGERLALERGD